VLWLCAVARCCGCVLCFMAVGFGCEPWVWAVAVFWGVGCGCVMWLCLNVFFCGWGLFV